MGVEWIYTKVGQTVRIDRVEEPEALVEIPEIIDGVPVTELGPYVLAGSRVERLRLPASIKKIGAYAFYECESLRHLECFGGIRDLGTGLFAGTASVGFLDMTECEKEKSCLKDLLSELRQTLRLRLRRGGEEARLIFPEYFEESVENTPARILFIETHGCGHRYRYCFANRQFQFGAYDELFAHVQVQESKELVTELALGRLLWPWGLTESCREMYLEYVRAHWQTAGKLLIAACRPGRERTTNLEPGGVQWLVREGLNGATQEQLGELAGMAQSAGNAELVSWLMDQRQKQSGTNGRKRRFAL